jgi:hypothetical protein
MDVKEQELQRQLLSIGFSPWLLHRWETSYVPWVRWERISPCPTFKNLDEAEFRRRALEPLSREGFLEKKPAKNYLRSSVCYRLNTAGRHLQSKIEIALLPTPLPQLALYRKYIQHCSLEEQILSIATPGWWEIAIFEGYTTATPRQFARAAKQLSSQGLLDRKVQTKAIGFLADGRFLYRLSAKGKAFLKGSGSIEQEVVR